MPSKRLKNNMTTVGKAARDLLLKNQDPVSVIDQARENLTDYEKNVYECIATNKKKFSGDFYVVVITKTEKILNNVLRDYFFARHSCPTPDYDQIVYKYTLENDHIEFLWVIPSRYTCHYLLEHRKQVAPEEYSLLDYVLKFSDGTLFDVCKKLNKEVDT